MSKDDPEATVTAGNASGQNDGAADLHRHPRRAGRRARAAPARPAGRVGGRRRAAGDDGDRARARRPSARSARAGLALERSSDLIELNEAFAAQVLAVLREWGCDDGFERVNVNGSGISLGHPVGATGARILATLLRELDRREGRYGLETMCIGGGQGLAAVFERAEG